MRRASESHRLPICRRSASQRGRPHTLDSIRLGPAVDAIVRGKARTLCLAAAAGREIRDTRRASQGFLCRWDATRFPCEQRPHAHQPPRSSARLDARSLSVSRQKMHPPCRRNTTSSGRSSDSCASVCPAAPSKYSLGGLPASLRIEPGLAVVVFARKACNKIAPNGIHQMRSFARITQPSSAGRLPWKTPHTNPIGPKTLPSNPTNTMGQWRAGSRAAIR